MIQSILLPINDTTYNTNALRYGSLMALQMKQPIQLFKVFNPQWIPASAWVGSDSVPTSTAPFGENAIQVINPKKCLLTAQKEIENIKEDLTLSTLNKLPIQYTISQGESVDKIHQYTEENPESLLIIGQEDHPKGLDTLASNITTRLLGKLNTLMIVVPDTARSPNIKRILYLVEDLNDIKDNIQQLAKLDPSEEIYIHIVLSYSGVENSGAWDSEKLKANILANINYPKLDLEIRGEKNLYPIAQTKVTKQAFDLIALHNRSLNYLLERFYMPNAAAKMALKTEVPLLIFPEPR